MKNIVSFIKDELRNHAKVTYEDGSREIVGGFVQNQDANEEIVCVIKDDQAKHTLVVYGDGSREYIFASGR